MERPAQHLRVRTALLGLIAFGGLACDAGPDAPSTETRQAALYNALAPTSTSTDFQCIDVQPSECDRIRNHLKAPGVTVLTQGTYCLCTKNFNEPAALPSSVPLPAGKTILGIGRGSVVRRAMSRTPPTTAAHCLGCTTQNCALGGKFFDIRGQDDITIAHVTFDDNYNCQRNSTFGPGFIATTHDRSRCTAPSTTTCSQGALSSGQGPAGEHTDCANPPVRNLTVANNIFMNRVGTGELVGGLPADSVAVELNGMDSALLGSCGAQHQGVRIYGNYLASPRGTEKGSSNRVRLIGQGAGLDGVDIRANYVEDASGSAIATIGRAGSGGFCQQKLSNLNISENIIETPYGHAWESGPDPGCDVLNDSIGSASGVRFTDNIVRGARASDVHVDVRPLGASRNVVVARNLISLGDLTAAGGMRIRGGQERSGPPPASSTAPMRPVEALVFRENVMEPGSFGLEVAYARSAVLTGNIISARTEAIETNQTENLAVDGNVLSTPRVASPAIVLPTSSGLSLTQGTGSLVSGNLVRFPAAVGVQGAALFFGKVASGPIVNSDAVVRGNLLTNGGLGSAALVGELDDSFRVRYLQNDLRAIGVPLCNSAVCPRDLKQPQRDLQGAFLDNFASDPTFSDAARSGHFTTYVPVALNNGQGSVTVMGARPGDTVLLGPDIAASANGITYAGYVSSDHTVTIRAIGSPLPTNPRVRVTVLSYEDPALAVTVSCDDGNPCTVDPAPVDGVCAGDRPAAPAGTACNDNNACTETDVCQGTLCVGATKSCNDNNTCTADSCDSATGACQNLPAAEGTSCGGTDSCSQSICQVGMCIADPRRSPICDVEPLLSCVVQNGNDFTAVFGYRNNKSTTIHQPVSDTTNFLTVLPGPDTGPLDRGQPKWFKGATTSEPTQPAAFSLKFQAGSSVRWTLGTRSVEADDAAFGNCSMGTSGVRTTVTIPGSATPYYFLSLDSAAAQSTSQGSTSIHETALPGGTVGFFAAGATPASLNVNHDGAAVYSIPIRVPAGPGGFAPKSLAITYNSQGGNGLLGVGWHLNGQSEITRCPRHPVNGDTEAVPIEWNELPLPGVPISAFCLDSKRLIYDAPSDAFRLEDDPTTRVKVVRDPAPSLAPRQFTVEDGAGNLLTYGETDGSMVEGYVTEYERNPIRLRLRHQS
jgi:hypothetical protein